MSVNLVRIESDTPNIQNSDDIRAFKYAGLGKNGVIKDYLNECGYTSSGLDFTIKSGEIIVDAWQVDISASGETITLNDISGTLYYSIFLVVDLSISDNKRAYISSDFDSADYPTIDVGDDVSIINTGIARYELYRLKVENKVIQQVISRFDYLNGEAEIAKYASSDKSKGTIEERLTKLGFKQGTIPFLDSAKQYFTDDSIITYTRQGNYVIITMKLTSSTPLISMAKTNKLIGVNIASIPEVIKPKVNSLVIPTAFSAFHHGSGSIYTNDLGASVYLNHNNSNYINISSNWNQMDLSILSQLSTPNVITIGYEAKPL